MTGSLPFKKYLNLTTKYIQNQQSKPVQILHVRFKLSLTKLAFDHLKQYHNNRKKTKGKGKSFLQEPQTTMSGA